MIAKPEYTISREDFYKSVISIYNNKTFARLYADHLCPQRKPPIRSAIDKFISILPKNGLILDLGCGTGKDVAYLRAIPFRAFGVDVSKPMIQMAKRFAKGGYFVRCDFRNLSCFRPRTFDAILCLASLQHVFRPDIGEFIGQVSLLLRENGLILIITKEGYGIYLDKRLGVAYARPTTLFTHEELYPVLYKQGFNVLDHGSFTLEREGRADIWLAIIAQLI